MSEWIEWPWTQRWWRVPGDVLLSQSIEGRQETVTFEWCNEDAWGLDFWLDGERSKSATFHIDPEDISGAEGVSREILAATLQQLKARERGIRDRAKLSADPVLNSIAEHLPKQEWITGRRLRKLTGLDVEVFNQHLARLMPRYVRRDGFEADDRYSLTLPGLIATDTKLRSIALMERLYQAVGRCYERDDDADVFENDDLIACGIAEHDIATARTIARICLLGGTMPDERALRVPADREMIAAQIRKKVRFLDYLHHSATESQRNAHYAVKRPWLYAPLWVERDGSRPDYLPIDFHTAAFPSLGIGHTTRVEAEASDDAEKVREAAQPSRRQPAPRLPRLDVRYGEKLGDGAFGTVWEATDTLLERTLAVKFLTSTGEALDEDALLRQARSLAKVAHPNLVVVHSAAWLRHPQTGLVAPAIMMERLEGEQLSQWSSVPQNRESVLRVATGLLNGISAMHAAGLHHGDLHTQNVLVLHGGQAKVIDWRYQDTFLARSTASRNELVEADQRHAIDLVVSLFEKQGLKEESLELRRATSLTEAQAVIERFANATQSPVVAPTAVVEEVTTFPPAPVRLDRADANEKETSEEQSELAIWPARQSDLDASELMAELDALVRRGVSTAPINMLFDRPPVSIDGARRWPITYRSHANVIQKWELEIRDAGFLAFRWAKFTDHDLLLYDTRELLDGVVVPIHLYELATAAAAKTTGSTPVDRVHLRLKVAASSQLLLRDNADVTTHAIYSPKSNATWQTRLEAQLPGEPGAIAARLINRALSNFQFEKERFINQLSNTSSIKLDPAAYDKYLQAARVKKTRE